MRKKMEAKEARSSRKAVKGKEFMQTNICDISSLHTCSPIPLCLGCAKCEGGAYKNSKERGYFFG